MPMRSLAAFAILIGLASAVLAAAPSAAGRLQPSPSPVPATFFGLHMHYEGSKTPWPSASFGTWRLWDAYVQWPHLEPEKGKWNFGLLDRYVHDAEAHNVEILLPLGLTPRWASARPDEKSAYAPGFAAEPADMADWRNYVRAVATRYKGRIRYYEIWNEPSLARFFSGKPEVLVALAREANQVLKQVDPAIVVVSPSAVGAEDGPLYLDRYLQAGGGKFADVIGFHFYVPAEAPEAMLGEIRAVRLVMQRHGLSEKPLWNTEAGWSIQNHQPAPVAYEFKPVLDDSASQAYIARAFLLAWAAGLQRYYWYSWDSENTGLVEPDHKSGKPAAAAYAEVQRWLLGSVMKECVSEDVLWTCTLTDPRGRPAWIVWNPAGVSEYRIPRQWQVRHVRHLSGATGIVESSRVVKVGPAPVMLTDAPRYIH